MRFRLVTFLLRKNAGKVGMQIKGRKKKKKREKKETLLILNRRDVAASNILSNHIAIKVTIVINDKVDKDRADRCKHYYIATDEYASVRKDHKNKISVLDEQRINSRLCFSIAASSFARDAVQITALQKLQQFTARNEDTVR